MYLNLYRKSSRDEVNLTWPCIMTQYARKKDPERNSQVGTGIPIFSLYFVLGAFQGTFCRRPSSSL